jgi:hypothetical protein
VPSAVSGRTDSQTDLVGGRQAAARGCLAPWDLLPRDLGPGAICPYASASCPISSGPHDPLRQPRWLPDLYEVVAHDEGISYQLIVGETHN